MAAMNAVLHGFDQSPIVRRDSIGGGEDKWDEVQFDCILENPPFSGAAQSPKRSLRVEKGEKYILFLAAAIRSLRPGGRAGIVLIKRFSFGIHLGGDDLLMFFLCDGPFVLKLHCRPLPLGDERPRQPVHVHAEVVQSP
jgi:hypothetical protein